MLELCRRTVVPLVLVTLMAASCGSTPEAQIASADPVEPGVEAIMELFELFAYTDQQEEAVEKLVQIQSFSDVADCVNVQEESALELAAWPDIALEQPSRREAETATLWPLTRWYSPASTSFAMQFGLGIENQFLRAESSSGGYDAFDEQQSRIFATFAASSDSNRDLLASCVDSTIFSEYESFVPPSMLAMNAELEEELAQTFLENAVSFQEWPSCMADAGFEVERPEMMFEFFMQETEGDPFPVDESPTRGQPGPTWLASREFEVALAVADAGCRRDAIEEIAPALLQIADDFAARNTNPLSQLTAEWDSVIADASLVGSG